MCCVCVVSVCVVYVLCVCCVCCVRGVLCNLCMYLCDMFSQIKHKQYATHTINFVCHSKNFNYVKFLDTLFWDFFRSIVEIYFNLIHYVVYLDSPCFVGRFWGR